MNPVQLEIQELLVYANTNKRISSDVSHEITSDDFEQGYAVGQENAYEDFIDKLTELYNFAAGISPES